MTKYIFVLFLLSITSVLSEEAKRNLEDSNSKLFLGANVTRYENQSIYPYASGPVYPIYVWFHGLELFYRNSKNIAIGIKYQSSFADANTDYNLNIPYSFSTFSASTVRRESKTGTVFDLFFRTFIGLYKGLDSYLFISLGKHYSQKLTIQKLYPFNDPVSRINGISPAGTYTPDSMEIFLKPRYAATIGVGFLYQFAGMYFDISPGLRVIEKMNPSVLVNANYFKYHTEQVLSPSEVFLSQELAKNQFKNNRVETYSTINISMGICF